MSEPTRDGTVKVIACRKCGCRDFRVRRTEILGNGYRRRWRYCRNCGARAPTSPTIEIPMSDLEK